MKDTRPVSFQGKAKYAYDTYGMLKKGCRHATGFIQKDFVLDVPVVGYERGNLCLVGRLRCVDDDGGVVVNQIRVGKVRRGGICQEEVPATIPNRMSGNGMVFIWTMHGYLSCPADRSREEADIFLRSNKNGIIFVKNR
eukprot:scaffold2357_cov167-Amphora_coffeaeformis.AAC.13